MPNNHMELLVYSQESFRISYRPVSYFVSRLVFILPLCLLVISFLGISYFVVRLEASASAFLLTLVTLLLYTFLFDVLNWLQMFRWQDTTLAVGVSNTSAMLNWYFIGLWLPYKFLPVWLRWMYWVAFGQYSFSTIMMAVLDPDKVQEVTPNPYSHVWQPFLGLVLYLLVIMAVAFGVLLRATRRLRRPVASVGAATQPGAVTTQL